MVSRPADGEAPAVAGTSAGPVAVTKRDWVEWYEDLAERERVEMRERIVLASPDDIKSVAELKHFLLFHVEDLVAENAPGTQRLASFWHIVMVTRGRDDLAEDRRKAVAYLVAEYQNYLRDNPFVS